MLGMASRTSLSQRRLRTTFSLALLVACGAAFAGCGDDPPPAGGGAAGSGGSAGKGKGGKGKSSKGGSGGDAGSEAGQNSGATGGDSGGGGEGNSPSAGSGGSSAGNAGIGGSAGMAGFAGVSGSSGSGGSAGSAGTAGNAGTAGTAGSGPSACETCEATCMAGNGMITPDSCYEMPGMAQMGPAMSVARAVLCSNVLSCVYESQCAVYTDDVENPDFIDFTPCFCKAETQEELDNCVADEIPEAQVGPCLAEFEEAAETTTPVSIAFRLEDRRFALGVATEFINTCDATLCKDECLPYLECTRPGAVGCEGGTGGMGGTSGNGGSSGSSGASGTAGSGGTTAGSSGSGGSSGTTGGTSGAGGSSGVGGSAGTGGTSGAGGSSGTGGSGGDSTSAECLECELDTPACAELVGACDLLAAPEAALCNNVLDCARETNCASIQNTDCFCGPGVDPGDCLEGNVTPSGPCIAELKAGLQTNSTTGVLSRYVDRRYPGGLAMARVTCDRANCAGDIPVGYEADEICFAP